MDAGDLELLAQAPPRKYGYWNQLVAEARAGAIAQNGPFILLLGIGGWFFGFAWLALIPSLGLVYLLWIAYQLSRLMREGDVLELRVAEPLESRTVGTRVFYKAAIEVRGRRLHVEDFHLDEAAVALAEDGAVWLRVLVHPNLTIIGYIGFRRALPGRHAAPEEEGQPQ